MAEASNASASSKGQPEQQHHQHQTAQPGILPAAKQGYFLAQLHDGAASWMTVAIPAEDMPPSPLPGVRRIRFQVQPSGNRELRIRSPNWLTSRPQASMPATQWPVPLHMMPKLELQASESLSTDALLLEASPTDQAPADSPGRPAAVHGNMVNVVHPPHSQVRQNPTVMPYSQLSASERWNAVTSAQPPYALNSSYRSRLNQSPAGQLLVNSPLAGAAMQSPSYAAVYPNQQAPSASMLSGQQPPAAMQQLQFTAGHGKLPFTVAQQPADQEIGRCESGSAHSSQEATAQPHSHPDSSLAASGPLGLKLDPAQVLASAGLPAQPVASSPGVVRQSTKSSPKAAVPTSPEVDQQLAGSRASSEVSERAGHKRARPADKPSEQKALKTSHGASPQESSPPDKGFGRGAIPYRGVRRRAWGTFSSEIRDGNGNRKWLGTFATALEAAQAYDTAARKIPGAAKRCNFPEGDQGPVSPGVVTAKHPGAAAEHKPVVPKAAPKPAPESPTNPPSPATEDAPEPSDQGPAGVSQKICSRCKVLKSASDFTRDRYNRDMLSPCCRECARIKLTAMREKRRQENLQAKTVEVPFVKDPSTNKAVTFFVERILGYRKHPDCPRVLQFKVHWWGYPTSEDTWEPSSNLANAPLTYPWESDAKKANATKLLEEGYE